MHTQRTKIMINNKIQELVSICVAHSMEEIEFAYIIIVEYNTVHSKLDICILNNATCDVIDKGGIWNIKTSKATSVKSQINKLQEKVYHYINLNREWNLSKTK